MGRGFGRKDGEAHGWLRRVSYLRIGGILKRFSGNFLDEALGVKQFFPADAQLGSHFFFDGAIIGHLGVSGGDGRGDFAGFGGGFGCIVRFQGGGFRFEANFRLEPFLPGL